MIPTQMIDRGGLRYLLSAGRGEGEIFSLEKGEKLSKGGEQCDWPASACGQTRQATARHCCQMFQERRDNDISTDFLSILTCNRATEIKQCP
jgi:hypothetical protein